MPQNPTPSGKPRGKRVATPAENTVLSLSAPTKADGSVHANLATVIEKKYDTIELYADEDCKRLLAVVHSPDDAKVSNIASSLRNYIYAMIEGAFSGTGQGPDGSAVFVRDNFKAVQATTKADLNTVWLLATPKDGSRASVKKYQAKVGAIVQSLSLRADWVQLSETKHGLTRTKTRTRKAQTETPTVFI